MPSTKSLLIAALCMLIAQSSWPDTVRRGLGPEPGSLNIHQAQGLAAINLLRDLREGLITFDGHGERAPGAASRWQVLDGGRRYRFSLRPELQWSNGDPLTADDFVRAWRRAFDPATQASTAGLLGDVENAGAVLRGESDPGELGISAIGPGLLEVRLTEPAPWILEILAHPVSYPLHASVSGEGDLRASPVNGPFVLAEWTPRAMLRLEKNPRFHSAVEVALDAVEYFPIEEPSTELARYRAGELHVTETIPAGRFAWLKENLAGHLRVHPYLGSFWLGLNMKDEVLGQSVQLRRALSLAIDRATLVRVVLGAGELPAWSVVPPGMAGYEPAVMEESQMEQRQREVLAKELYRAAGYGQDKPLLLELRFNTSSLHRRVAVAVSAMWKQVLGVHSELINEEWKVFVNNRRMGVVTQVFRGGWIADYADPGSFLNLFLGGDPLNTTFYSHDEFDDLIARADLAQGERRMELLHQGETLLMQDMPVIPLYYYVSRHLVQPGISGFTDNVRDVHLSRYLALEEN
jgi:oligopeptide transport system substrate-binding protein